MTKCGGINDASYATCQKMVTGDISWLCDVIHGKDTVQQIYKKLLPALKPHTPAPSASVLEEAPCYAGPSPCLADAGTEDDFVTISGRWHGNDFGLKGMIENLWPTMSSSSSDSPSSEEM